MSPVPGSPSRWVCQWWLEILWTLGWRLQRIRSGSQVYARSAWHNDVWAIMYAWYFPKAADYKSQAIPGHRHYWEYAIVWIDNPALDNAKILGVSIAQGGDFEKETSLDAKFMNGSAVKLDSYHSTWGLKMQLKLTEDNGESQDLITWEQLTNAARDALNSAENKDTILEYTSFKSPLMDELFTDKLEKAWPF